MSRLVGIGVSFLILTPRVPLGLARKLARVQDPQQAPVPVVRLLTSQVCSNPGPSPSPSPIPIIQLRKGLMRPILGVPKGTKNDLSWRRQDHYESKGTFGSKARNLH